MRASLHRTAVGQLERGERVARVDTVVKLAGSLGIHPGELFDGMGWNPGGTRIGEFTTEGDPPPWDRVTCRVECPHGDCG